MRSFKEIDKYLKANILPQYKLNDSAHGEFHIKYVAKRALKFARLLGCDLSIVLVAAYYHDIGHHIDANNHDKISADIYMNDKDVLMFFSRLENQIIKEAIEDHRASNDHVPRSIYGEILSSADRSTSVKLAIKRSVEYNLNHYGKSDLNIVVENVYNYALKKYGERGYSKTYINDKKYNSFIKKMSFLLRKQELFKKIIMKEIKKAIQKM